MSNPQNSLVMIQFAIFLNADKARTEVLEFNPEQDSLKFLYSTIGCNLVECVQIGVDPKGYRIDAWVDEEGSFTAKNIVHLKKGTREYKFFGNVLILKSDVFLGDTIGFSPGDTAGMESLQVAYTNLMSIS